MDEAELEVVSKELDDLAIGMLRIMKEYIDAKITLENLIKSGSLHLAKSRYIMGNRNVSVLQLPTEDSNKFMASTTVVKVKDVEDTKFQISKFDASSSETGLRSRNLKADEHKKSEEENNTVPFTDPLKWFGVLVPQNMRQAQSNFSKALEYVIQCSNIQLEMDRLKKTYSLKLRKKQELLEV